MLMSYWISRCRLSVAQALPGFLLLLVGLLPGSRLEAAALDEIGITTLRTRDQSLTGSGIAVAQVEAPNGGDNAYQVSPAATGQDAGKFNFFDTTHPYPIGGSFSTASDHANGVAGNFYSTALGASPGVASVQVFEAGYFFNGLINQIVPVDVGAQVINQSFIFTDVDAGTTTSIHRSYDNYADQFGTLFINGAGNGGSVSPPAGMYNGIAVGSAEVTLTPLADGRSKPDIIAPGGLTSFTTPYVSGAAAIMMQAALRGDGGADASAASDMRTVKALLLNGASKTTGWSHTSAHPLDTAAGAGTLNVDRAHRLLAGGKHAAIATTGVTANALHPPPAGLTTPVNPYLGWNFATISNTNSVDTIDHYLFRLAAADSATFTLTSTLVWNRQRNLTSINNLELYLYNYDTTEIVAVSSSTVDNVEHLYVQNLSPGRYVLQVVKLATGRVSAAEDYALAFSFAPILPTTPATFTALTVSDTAIDLNWSDTSTNETGYRLERSLNASSGYQAIATVLPGTTVYHDTGLVTGTAYHYRVVAFNAGGDAEAATAQQSTYTEREFWRLTKFGTIANAGGAADLADPDIDGLLNVVEYALGTDPNSSAGANGYSARPVMGLYNDGEEKFPTLQISRVKTRGDVTYLVEFANAVNGPWGNAVTVITDTPELLEVRSNVPLTGSGHGFLRFSVVAE